MGIPAVKCSSSYYDDNVDSTSSNPNPNNYKILKSFESFPYLLVMIEYPDCDNYEGKKILLYETLGIKYLEIQGKSVGIDPHFSDNAQFHSPIARFVPTEKGWEMGKMLIERMLNDRRIK